MFYTGIDPRTGKKVYVAKSYEEKAMQRALMQYNHPQNRELVIKALKKAGRLDLIGHGENCLISYSAPRRFKNGTAEAVHNGNKTQPTRDARKGKGHEAENKPRNRHK